MVVNKLKLNVDKTELLFLTVRHRHPPPLDSILIGVDIIALCYIVRFQYLAKWPDFWLLYAIVV